MLTGRCGLNYIADAANSGRAKEIAVLYSDNYKAVSLTTFFHPSMIHRGLTAAEVEWMKSWCREHSLGTFALGEADQIMLHCLWHRTDHDGRSFMVDRHIQRFVEAVEDSSGGWDRLSESVRDRLRQISSRDRPYLNGQQILEIRLAALGAEIVPSIPTVS